MLLTDGWSQGELLEEGTTADREERPSALKKILLDLMVMLPSLILGQQWDGANNTTDPIYRTGNVGIGATTPSDKLHIKGQVRVGEGNGDLFVYGQYAWISWIGGNVRWNGSNLVYNTSNRGAFRIKLQHDMNVHPQYISFEGAPQGTAGGTISWTEIMRLQRDGKVGIGTTNPGYKLEVDGIICSKTGHMRVANNVVGGLNFWADVGGFSFNTYYGGWQERVTILDNGDVGIGTTTPGAKLDVNGTTRTKVIEITGGADLAEPFEIAGTESIKPGMVVSIDPEQQGQLRVSSRAYDRTVAGIISGAGGVNPGILMTQTGLESDTDYPLALTGRVYAWADAKEEPIEPGDLLTTSDTPGHIMKVTDHIRAMGATIGKAMSSLEEGEGLVLVLVALQ